MIRQLKDPGSAITHMIAMIFAALCAFPLIYKATWPDEQILHCTVGTLHQTVKDSGLTKTALIIVGNCMGDEYLRSKLYDPSFTTEFREAKQ